MKNTNKVAKTSQEIIKSRLDKLVIKKIELITNLRNKGFSNDEINRKMGVAGCYIDILAKYVDLMIHGASAKDVVTAFGASSIEDITELIVGMIWKMDKDGNELLDSEGNKILSESIIKAKEAIAKAS